MKNKRTPQSWQLDSNKLSTDRIQFWSGGSMSSIIPLEQAKIMVESGNAFVISDTAIGLLTDGEMDS